MRFVNSILLVLALISTSVHADTNANAKEHLNLDFQKIRLDEALHVYADFSGLNIVVDSALSDTVDIDLKDVKVSTFLDVLTELYDLHVSKKDNILMVMRRADYDARHTSKQTKVINVIYSDAGKLVESINKQSQAQPAQSTTAQQSYRNSLNSDDRSNSIIIEGTADFVERTTTLVQALDKQAKQLLISAKLVSMTAEDLKNLGAKLTASAKVKESGNYQLAEAFSNLATAATSGYSFALGKVGSYLLDLQVQAMQQHGTINILSRPSVLTLNNQKAKISQGVQIPFQIQDQNGAFHTEFQDAVLSLEVLPRYAEGNIIMEILVTKNNPSSTVAAGTTIEKRQIVTTVQVKPNETVILGGIREDVTESTLRNSPLFEGVPVLDWLFKSTQDSTNSKELLIFISPTLVDS